MSNSDEPIKVLLLIAGFGDGHRQVAEALREAFSERGVEVRTVDCFRGTNRVLAHWSEWLYEWLTAHGAWLYGASYRMTANLPNNHPLWELLAQMSRKAAWRALKDYRPQYVLQLFPDHALAKLPDTCQAEVAVVITDYSVHGRWFHHQVDTYFFPDQMTAAQAQNLVHEGAECVVSGIPLRSQFWHEQQTGNSDNRAVATNKASRPRDEQRNTAPGFAERMPYILLAAGGRGLFPNLHGVVATLANTLPGHQIYILCGRNDTMLRRVAAMSKRIPAVKGLPFTDDVASWLQHADCVIGKSGGVTVTEALASRCPMIVYRPQAGQEADNARFLCSIGAGKAVETLAELAEAVRDVVSPITHRKMCASCQPIARQDAANVIADYVVDGVSSKRE